LRSGVHGVPYHSIYGAFTESKYVFVEQGLSAWWAAASASEGGRRGCDVLEVGWGSGLNAACAWRWAQDQGVEVRYQALEPDPLPSEVLERLDHGERTGMGAGAFRDMMGVPAGQEIFNIVFIVEARIRIPVEAMLLTVAVCTFFAGTDKDFLTWVVHALSNQVLCNFLSRFC
jgi:hypothetical protein